MKFTKLSIFLVVALIPLLAVSQQTYTRTSRIGGATNDTINATTVDSTGNIYVAGSFSGTVDMNPGAGVDNKSSAGSDDIFLSKYSADGTYLWSVTFGNANSDRVIAIVHDSDDNIFITGTFSGIVDFNPEAGTDNITSSGTNSFLSRYNSDGTYAWTTSFGGPGTTWVNDMTISPGNELYLIGQYSGTADFQPGAGTTSRTSGGSWDIWVSKFQTDGTWLYSNTYSGAGEDIGRGISSDGSGNIYITGYFTSNIDWDPSVGTDNVATNGGWDIFISKNNSDGSYAWTKKIGGNPGWDWANDIAADNAGNVYIAGGFNGTVDFDPGPGVDNRTSFGLPSNLCLIKLLTDGSYDWALTAGTSGDDFVEQVTTDSMGNVYFTSYYQTNTDFDRSGAVASFTSNGAADVALTRYNANGTHAWTRSVGGTVDDHGLALAVDTSGRLLVGGNFQNTVDFNPGAAAENIVSNGGTDGWFSLYDQPSYSITGTITNSGNPLAGVTVDAGVLGDTTTDGSGQYSFIGVSANANYSLIATLTGYTFTPPSYSGTLNNNTILNFSADLNTYTISGTVTDGGNPLAGVDINGGALGTTVTAGDGTYSFTNIPHGTNYTLTPSLTGYSFSAAATGTLSGAALHDFTATLNLYTISGTATVNASPLSGVDVDGGALGTTVTAGDGTYSFTNIPHGTNYTLTPGLTGYSFSLPASGTLNGNALHNFTATADTPTTSSISGVIQQNGTPLSGATVTLVTSGGTLTIVTNSNGSYSFSGVTPGNGAITVEKNGMVIIDETITIAPGSNTPTLAIENPHPETPVYSHWNGFLDLVNVLELMNTSNTEVNTQVTVYDLDGAELSVFEVTIPAGSQRDVILNEVTGFSAESYGLLKVAGNGIDGRVTFYRGEGRRQVWGEEYEFVYSLELMPGISGETMGIWNTYTGRVEPQLGASNIRSTTERRKNAELVLGMPGKASILSPNWLNVVNLDSSTRNFTITYRDQGGSVITTATLTIPPYGKRDIQAGHEFTAPAVGLITITPHNLASPYLATITRYGENFAFATPTQPGNSAIVTLPAGGDGLNVLELSNTSNSPNLIELNWYGMNGEMLRNDTVTLPPYAQQHIIPTDILPEGTYGSVQLSVSANIIAAAASYLPETAYYQSSREIFGTMQSGTFNTYLGMDNWLRIVNGSASTQVATIAYGSESETVTVLAHGRHDLLIPISSVDAADGNYGILTLESSLPGVFTASVVRSRHTSAGVDFQTVLAVR